MNTHAGYELGCEAESAQAWAQPLFAVLASPEVCMRLEQADWQELLLSQSSANAALAPATSFRHSVICCHLTPGKRSSTSSPG